ncbi:MAG: hypothetical protein LBI63_01005 [Candidatus Ancillula sp.]|jgi:hypothetical protein|nr:hypothetical protein [Candidatus Ancillula sp.]
MNERKAMKRKLRKVIGAGAMLLLLVGSATATAFASTTTQGVNAIKGEFVKSIKQQLEPYLHDYSNQTSVVHNAGEIGTFFESASPNEVTLADKLYINATGSENLKTKQDVENFLNNKSDDVCIMFLAGPDKNPKNSIIGIDQVDCKFFNNPDDTLTEFFDDFHAKVFAVFGGAEDQKDALNYLVENHSMVYGDVVNGCSNADACLFSGQGDIGFIGSACYLGKWKNINMIMAIKRDTSFYLDDGRSFIKEKGSGTAFGKNNLVTVNTVNTY